MNCRMFRTFRLLYVLFFLVSCSNQNQTINEEIRSVYGEIVEIPVTEMIRMNENKSNFNHCKYHFLVYQDEESCSDCALSHYSEWEEVLSDFLQIKESVDLTIIWEGNHLEEDIREGLCSTDYSRCIYWDSTYIFKKRNPKLSCHSYMHTLLLDSLNQIILVGNPILNPRIRQLALKRLENRNDK